MIFEGDMGVIDALKEKKRLMEAGEEHGHIRPLLIIDGGLMKGVYGVGAGLSFEELGYTKVFSNVVGISSGAPTAAYLLSSELEKGIGLFFEICCSRKFLNMWRFWNQVDTKYLIEGLKNPINGIKAKKVLASRSSLYIGVANFETGEPKLLKPENEEELFTAINASILMPNVSTDIVKFKDIRYVDGGFTKPHIMKPAIEEIEATHVLVLTNQDKTVTTLPRFERFLNHTIYRWRMPKPLRFAAHERRKERMKVVEDLKNKYQIPYALVWGDHSIRSMERESIKIAAVMEKSRRWWHELLKV